jgi:hypothetical protein
MPSTTALTGTLPRATASADLPDSTAFARLPESTALARLSETAACSGLWPSAVAVGTSSGAGVFVGLSGGGVDSRPRLEASAGLPVTVGDAGLRGAVAVAGPSEAGALAALSGGIAGSRPRDGPEGRRRSLLVVSGTARVPAATRGTEGGLTARQAPTARRGTAR